MKKRMPNLSKAQACYQEQIMDRGYQADPFVVAALERDRVTKVLDDWRQSLSGGIWTMGYRCCCVLRIHDMATGAIETEHVFDGRTEHEARAKAAAAIEAGEV